jgi:hypothetical protein
MALMDDTPTDRMLSDLEAADPSAAVAIADALAARLGAALAEEGDDAPAPSA